MAGDEVPLGSLRFRENEVKVARTERPIAPLVSPWQPQRKMSWAQRISKRFSWKWVAPMLVLLAFQIGVAYWLVPSGHASAGFSGAAGFMGFLSFALAVRPRRKLRRKQLLLDDLDQPHACVEAVYYRDKDQLGSDSGVLFCVDGWLVFEGERTWFSLKRVEVDGDTGSWGSAEPDYILSATDRSFRVAVFDLKSRRSTSVIKVRQVCEAWLRSGVSPAGLSVYPPRCMDSYRLVELADMIPLAVIPALLGAPALVWGLVALGCAQHYREVSQGVSGTVMGGCLVAASVVFLIAYPFERRKRIRLIRGNEPAEGHAASGGA
jgi:hypothetical protein